MIFRKRKPAPKRRGRKKKASSYDPRAPRDYRQSRRHYGSVHNIGPSMIDFGDGCVKNAVIFALIVGAFVINPYLGGALFLVWAIRRLF